MTALLGTLSLFGLLAIGMPVGFAMLLAGAFGLWLFGGTTLLVGYLTTTPLASASSFELITVPMFILMAEFVILSGVANSLFTAAATWVGRARGGLGIATAVAGAGFGAICGSSTASAATLSATSVPAMLERGYEPKMATGVVAISGTLAMLIPPSIALVLYAIIADQNIGDLLIGGVVPGIIVTLAIALTVYLLALRRPESAPRGPSFTMREKFASLKVAGPVILLFMAVTGVIYLGVATPTEAAALGAIGAFLICLAYGKISRRTIVQAITRSAATTCMIFLILMGAKFFGYFFTLTQVTQNLIGFVDDQQLSPATVLVLVLVLYFILGCFMDQAAILILTVPVLLPLMISLGYDPVWFGVVVIVMAEIGLVTPPLGLNAFVVAKYTGRPLEEVFSGLWPHILAHLIVVAILCLFPETVLWLPGQMQ
ncbi:TRAP transporter large permease [Aquamicrobium sp. LC103]|uniref:TRAP transporter large permease n=1 Tax=Aquamicrobium sp. LC103 TaxID=1120658 RepID=UPI00063EBE44|nr:TRAP transporter large permease [Aquamicrobium sp. LC103]TKT69480.1 TRAP transporter large permease [Aquamicrobium sp. LC103]